MEKSLSTPVINVSKNVVEIVFADLTCIASSMILQTIIVFSWAKAPALYVTMSQEEVEEVEDHFLDLAFRAQIELRNVKVKVTLR